MPEQKSTRLTCASLIAESVSDFRGAKKETEKRMREDKKRDNNNSAQTRDDSLKGGALNHVCELGAGARMTQQALGRHHHQRFAVVADDNTKRKIEHTMMVVQIGVDMCGVWTEIIPFDLAAQGMKVIGRCCEVHH